MSEEKKLMKIALLSRLFLICIQYAGNHLIPDHKAGAFMYPKPKNTTFYDDVIEHLLGGFLRWDAQYFMHIARYGYTYENTLAFFPVYPLLARLISLTLHSLIPFVSLDYLILIVFIILNIVLFIFSTLTLYQLTLEFFSQKIAFTSAMLFCLNPASVFFIAPYTECLFSFLTFKSALNCIKLYKKYCITKCSICISDLVYLIPISLSTAVRSNGVLNVGFLLYSSSCVYVKLIDKTKSRVAFTIKLIITVTFTCAVCLAPFILFQWYCYHLYCTNFESHFPNIITDHAKKGKFILPGQFLKHNQSWCYKKLPLAYSYVQDHYWDVGFLRYYELKQLPNFILAAPILFILINGCLKHMYLNLSKNGFQIFTFNKLKSGKRNEIHDCDAFIPEITVFVVHGLFLSVFCLLCIHVQVSTRLLCSASPLVYWICASYLRSPQFLCNSNNPSELFVKNYFISYFIAGSILFCNFLPWT